MTAPIRPDLVEQELARIRGQKPKAVDVDAELARLRTAQPSQPAAPTTVDRLRSAGAVAQTFADASTFGAAGLVDDALSAMATSPVGGMRENFAARRAERRTNRENLSGGARIGATVAGALANPVGAGFRAAQGSGLLWRATVGAGNAALQGGAMAGAEGLDDLSPEGIKRAATAALYGGQAGLLTAGALGLGAKAVSGINTLRRVGNATPIDKVAFRMLDDMGVADDALYGAVRREAGEIGTTPAIQDVLESQTVKPFADRIRKSETYAGADDATVLIESYKLMSNAQRRAAKQISGTPDFLADVELQRSDIGLAKKRMMGAATTPGEVVVPGRAVTLPAPSTAQSPAPSVRDAIEAHRTRLGQSVTRKEGTSMQQIARQALERQDMERVASPSLSGAPQELRGILRESQTVPIRAGLPSFPEAVNTHRIAAGENEAFLNTADAVRNVLEGNSVRGKKLTLQSPEALRRAIAGPRLDGVGGMTKEEAKRALEATLGRGREVFKMTSNPVGQFGLVSSIARSIHAPFQIDEFVQLLHKQAGMRQSPFDSPVLGGTLRAAGARAAGGLLNP